DFRVPYYPASSLAFQTIGPQWIDSDPPLQCLMGHFLLVKILIRFQEDIQSGLRPFYRKDLFQPGSINCFNHCLTSAPVNIPYPPHMSGEMTMFNKMCECQLLHNWEMTCGELMHTGQLFNCFF